MMTETTPGLLARLTAIECKLDQMCEMFNSPRQERAWYTLKEAAKELGRATFTVRDWCRHGRINAIKRLERRGGAELWSISADELLRYRNEGLLAFDPQRNAGR